MSDGADGVPRSSADEVDGEKKRLVKGNTHKKHKKYLEYFPFSKDLARNGSLFCV